MDWILYIAAGIGAGAVTGLAGLSAAVVITPLLVGFCGWESYNAVTVALASDVLASLLTANTYRKNNNIDIKRGLLVGIFALIGTLAGSYSGYLFSKAQPNGLGYISMLTTITLGIKFLVKPMNGGLDADSFNVNKHKNLKTALAMACGCVIGWVCGFTGSGGGVLMLTVFTLILGYNLKVAVGTSTLIMFFVALVGAISHLCLGATVKVIPAFIVVITCLVSAIVSAGFANKCNIKRLNRIIGTVLLVLGIVTICSKILMG